MSDVLFSIENRNLMIYLPNKLDISNSNEVLTKIEEELAKHKVSKIIYDMKNCDFISSAGIGIIANLTRQAKEDNVKTKVVNYNDSIKEILEVTDILAYIGTE